jgi:ferredoxin-NADP reductase
MGAPRKIKATISGIENYNGNVKRFKIQPHKSIVNKYKPGQFLHLTLDEYDPSYNWPESRVFSIATPPDQASEIDIVVSQKGRYTKRMFDELLIGKEIWIKLAYGDLFSKHHSHSDAVFIAGGTGITPFLSLFNHNSFASYSRPVLFAGFRNKSFNHYKDELEGAKRINHQFKYIPVYQDKDGILDISEIFSCSKSNSSFFISGPPQMIKSFKKTLIDMRVRAENILTDDWE